MSKLLSTLIAGAAAMTLAGATFAAEQPKDSQSRDNQTQTQPNATQGKPEQADANKSAEQSTGGQSQGAAQSSDSTQQSQTPNQANQSGADEGNMGRKPDQPGGTASAEEKAYMADIKKCDSLTGEQMRKCVDAAKKKHGQM